MSFFVVLKSVFYVREYVFFFVLFFKQKTAYEMRISDWSSDVCSSDLADADGQQPFPGIEHPVERSPDEKSGCCADRHEDQHVAAPRRIEEIGRASCRERVCQYV